MNSKAQTMSRDQARWLRSRRSGIGASECPAALGQSPWSSPYSLYQSKVNPQDEGESDEENAAMHWGSQLEPAIRREVKDRLGQPVTNPGRYTMVRHPVDKHMFCTLNGMLEGITPAVRDLFGRGNIADGYESSLEGAGVLQIKTTNAFAGSDWDHSWPVYYQCQCQHELYVTGSTWGVLAVLIGGQDFRMLPYVLYDEFVNPMVRGLADFWGRVVRREPPPVDGSQATAVALAALYPEASGSTCDLPDEAAQWTADLDRLSAVAAGTAEQIEALRNRIRLAMGDSSFGLLPDGRKWSWKTRKASSYTVTRKASRSLIKPRASKFPGSISAP